MFSRAERPFLLCLVEAIAVSFEHVAETVEDGTATVADHFVELAAIDVYSTAAGALDVPCLDDGGSVEVVLAFSLKLRDKLQATGRYKVLMTRETDKFVELHERREFAERNMASLFVAVHADYARSSARGATIYSLRDSVADALQRSARGEVSEHVLSESEIRALKRTDGDVYLRPAIWYRRELRPRFRPAGGGIFLRPESPAVLYELETCR